MSNRYIDGFPSLAAFIASDRDRSALIFKRFSRLAVRNLLLIQAELAELEARLDAFDTEDSKDRTTLQSLRNWSAYKARGNESPERLEVVHQIRGLLKEYREALLFESTLASIKPPDRKTLKAFLFNFHHGKPGEPQSFPMLGGSSSTVYDDVDDLVSLHDTDDLDRLTIFVRERFGFLFSDTSPAMAEASAPDIAYASQTKITRFISYLSTALAAILLFGAMLILYNVKSNNLKLGLVALFTILFASSVGLLTSAKQSEVYGATAAYAAVLVVFISGNVGGQECSPQ